MMDGYYKQYYPVESRSLNKNSNFPIESQNLALPK
jgi:hypothetical protein